MKKVILTLLTSFLFLSISFSQTTIWSEPFNGTNPEGPIFNMECFTDTAYFAVVCEPGGGCPNEVGTKFWPGYTGIDGTFLGAFDTDRGFPGGPCGVNFDFETVEWNGIDISGCASGDRLYLCFDIAEGSSPTDPWDENSSVRFNVSLDGSSFIQLGEISAIDGPSATNAGSPSFDLDCDGHGEGPGAGLITSAFTTYCFNLPGPGNTIDLLINVEGFNQQPGEDVAIDNIEIICDVDDSNLPGLSLIHI